MVSVYLFGLRLAVRCPCPHTPDGQLRSLFWKFSVNGFAAPPEPVPGVPGGRMGGRNFTTSIPIVSSRTTEGRMVMARNLLFGCVRSGPRRLPPPAPVVVQRAGG